MRPTIVLAALLAIVGAAHAQVERASVRGAVGQWRLSEVGGKVACTLGLTNEASIGGLEVRAPLACRGAFPALKTVSTWSFDADGAMVFSDPTRRRIVTFHAHGRGYDAAAPGGKTWRLDPAPGARMAISPPRMSGAFRLTDAQGADLCDFVLRPDMFGGTGAIKTGACNAPWAAKGFAAWTLRGGRLTLLDRRRKPILVLTPSESGVFSTADASGFAVSLGRP
jgi:hypothetical protein